ncbi:oxidoreductase domain protein [Pelosinus fermentans DSM 17108]|uniref:Gfo/Idh/MocA family protein n=1 Tax=Pelosinus fermentans TaxID=365349 RepID=UPI0002684647|nr:Gfo/Idh/MocA family oxidoreductase [Pelosinus fermentans]OAM92535.1 oxidoreductase domain protein [Pelosinus fermentans DSM 17108]
MDKVKVGIIGTGFIGPAHIEALRRLGFVEIVALADSNEAVAKQKAEVLHVDKYYGDYMNLLADKEIDAVHICTPNHLHYRMAKEALLAGKHVVCEKPLAVNTEQANELVEIAREKQLVNAVHLTYDFIP